MTTETSTTAISSVSGLNLTKNSNLKSNNYVQKRNVYQFETEKIEQQSTENSTCNTRLGKISSQLFNWIFCSPCIHFLKTSKTFHKMTLTSVTLIVVCLLVVSPIIFLLSFAKNQQTTSSTKHCDECVVTVPPPTCRNEICQKIASSIQAKIDWKIDFCNDFKSFSCSNTDSLKIVRTPQEIVDYQMIQLLSQNTTIGAFKKLGRLYESCLRQHLNSSTIRLVFEKLGGYIPQSHIGPNSVTSLIKKMNEMGAPLILFDMYYDLSYGKNPQILLMIDMPTDVQQILQNPLRWDSPRAPSYLFEENSFTLFDEMLNFLLPSGLTSEAREDERSSIFRFIFHFMQIRKDYVDRDFSNSLVVNNVSTLMKSYPLECLKPYLNVTEIMPKNLQGPIVIKNQNYMRSLKDLLSSHSSRVIHNSLLLIFSLNILPNGNPSPLTCARATMAKMPEATSALYVSQFSDEQIRDGISRASNIFDLLKAHLKRAPSLRGFALVRLASLKFQAEPWPPLIYNISDAMRKLEELEITSNDWFENVLRIYGHRCMSVNEDITINESMSWAYPTISRAFYDHLSHKIVVPLSLIMVPHFDAQLPAYLHFSTVGIDIAKEILRSVTKSFEKKALQCVPPSIFSNSSRMELLISSGGMQIAYHSMLTLSGTKSMASLPGINLSSTQLFFLMTAQEMCLKSKYEGVATDSQDFHDILFWLIAQGGKATIHFPCQHDSNFRMIQNCGIW